MVKQLSPGNSADSKGKRKFKWLIWQVEQNCNLLGICTYQRYEHKQSSEDSEMYDQGDVTIRKFSSEAGERRNYN